MSGFVAATVKNVHSAHKQRAALGQDGANTAPRAQVFVRRMAAAWTSSGYQLRDLEAPNALLEVATRRARGSDLIFLATGPDATSLAMAQNTVHMLARLGLQGHAVLLADSLETCERVGERILGADACFWTSRMLGVRPSDSVSLRKYWDWRFRFYWVASP